MKRLVVILGLAALVATAGGVSLAELPPGLAKEGKVPPGFSHGKKTGWQNEYPPGWDKKSEKERDQWKQAVKKGRDRVSKDAKEKGMRDEDADSAANDFEKAARKGLDPEEAEFLVKDKIKKGKKGKELSDTAAEKPEKRLQEKNRKAKKEKGKGKKK